MHDIGQKPPANRDWSLSSLSFKHRDLMAAKGLLLRCKVEALYLVKTVKLWIKTWGFSILAGESYCYVIRDLISNPLSEIELPSWSTSNSEIPSIQSRDTTKSNCILEMLKIEHKLHQEEHKRSGTYNGKDEQKSTGILVISFCPFWSCTHACLSGWIKESSGILFLISNFHSSEESRDYVLLGFWDSWVTWHCKG